MKKIRKFNEFLEIPNEVISNTPKITMNGFDEIIIENYKNILEYEEFYIKVNTYIGALNINGFNLTLNQLNKEDIMITGTIENIDFEKIKKKKKIRGEIN